MKAEVDGAVVEARGLVKSFGPTPALRGVSVAMGLLERITGPEVARNE